MQTKTLYTASVTAQGGREGNITSADGVLNMRVVLPKELGGPGGPHTNPEQLFAAGYAACFDSALQLVMRMAKINPLPQTSVTAQAGLVKNEQGGYSLTLKLEVSVPGVEKELAQQLINKAHHVCPYSNATRGNIPVELILL